MFSLYVEAGGSQDPASHLLERLALDTLRFTWDLPFGQPGEDSSPLNPLARSLRRLLREDGQPFSRLCLCFFKDVDVARWLGVFVHSAGGRVLFFPAIPETIDTVQAFKSTVEVTNQPFAFDHVSLERDLQIWHATSISSAKHIGGPTTLPLGEGRVLWFGMSVASAGVLRVLRAKSVVTAEVPPSDTKRRAAVLKTARENMEFPMLSLNSDAPAPSYEGFLHFGVVVGPKGFADYLGPELGFPFGSPYVVGGLAPLQPGLPLRTFRIALSDTIDIQIVCAFLPGKLSVPIGFTAPSNKP